MSKNKGSDHSHSRFDVGSGYYGEKRTNTGNGGGPGSTKINMPPSQQPSNPVQAKTGPLQVPNIGPLTYAFNKISKGLYDKKNLKEARKNDILGGEMLTTGQKKVTLPTSGNGNNQQQLCPDGSIPPCKSPVTQIKKPITQPNQFLTGFRAYDDGGEVVISSNVDKSLL